MLKSYGLKQELKPVQQIVQMLKNETLHFVYREQNYHQDKTIVLESLIVQAPQKPLIFLKDDVDHYHTTCTVDDIIISAIYDFFFTTDTKFGICSVVTELTDCRFDEINPAAKQKIKNTLMYCCSHYMFDCRENSELANYMNLVVTGDYESVSVQNMLESVY